MYSRYASKADLFLDLLEARIDARAADNERRAHALVGVAGLTELLADWRATDRARTRRGPSSSWSSASTPPVTPPSTPGTRRSTSAPSPVSRTLQPVLGAAAEPGVARMVLAIGTGATLEHVTDHDRITAESVARVVVVARRRHDRALVKEGAAVETYSQIRERHVAAWRQVLGDRLGRLRWSRCADRCRAGTVRCARPRHSARSGSAWHAPRLAHVDVDRLTAGDLTSLPTMTKHDVLAAFDDLVTDRRITRRDGRCACSRGPARTAGLLEGDLHWRRQVARRAARRVRVALAGMRGPTCSLALLRPALSARAGAGRIPPAASWRPMVGAASSAST